MAKKISKFEAATIKRVAQSVNPYIKKRNKFKDLIEKAMADLEEANRKIEAFESPIKEMTGGYTTEDLVDKVVENGTTSYSLKYPETILPPVEEVESKEGEEEGSTLIPEPQDTVHESLHEDVITEISDSDR